jgi:endonuclease III related protein
MDRAREIRTYYKTLYSCWGAQGWWPARSRFEVVVGAYLTQNTAWTNVERAIEKLAAAHLLTLAGIRGTSVAELEQLIRSAGYFRQKAQRLKTFVAYVDSKYNGSLDRMFSQPTQKVRDELLVLNGVGPETADSILLYAGNHPVFVVDAYTRRVVERHAILPATASYELIRELFERSLSDLDCDPVTGSSKDLRGAAHHPSRVSRCKRTPLVQRFNEMHALVVGVGKNHCFNRNPDCRTCPLRSFLPQGR